MVLGPRLEETAPRVLLSSFPPPTPSSRPPHPFRHTPQTFRGPIGSSSEGHSGCVRMRPPHPFRHTPHTSRRPIGSSSGSPNGCVRMRPPRPFRHIPHTSCRPIGSSLSFVKPALRYSQLHMLGSFARIFFDWPWCARGSMAAGLCSARPVSSSWFAFSQAPAPMRSFQGAVCEMRRHLL